MGGSYWSKFFWSDWESDQGLKQCSLAAQGLWMRMLCICAKSDPCGYLVIHGKNLNVEALAKAVSASAAQVDALLIELENWGVFSRDRKGRIYNRRMIKDEKRSQEGRKWKKQGLQQAAENKEEKPLPSRGASLENEGCLPPISKTLEARSKIEKKDDLKKVVKENEFDDWWSLVPRKVGKGDARKAFKAARKKTDAETLKAGIIRYAREVAGKDDEFIAHPAKWLNGERWLDEPERKTHGNRPSGNGKDKPSAHQTLYNAHAHAAGRSVGGMPLQTDSSTEGAASDESGTDPGGKPDPPVPRLPRAGET